ncbi:MAG: flagellar basal body L-ring protein FlgH [Paracoccaceae bacterium]
MRLGICLLCVVLAGCGRLDAVGRAPEFNPLEGSYQHAAMYTTPLPEDLVPQTPTDASSLWASGQDSLFSDRRASRTGDILTVVIEIDDSAEFSNTSGRSRTGSESSSITGLFGIPQRLDAALPEGASSAQAVETSGSSTFNGEGSTARNEQLTLRVAATVVDELPNGVLRIEGMQEVRVNFEMRELLISGYVRPIDISRQNEITYDKIAGAQISYGGRGQITDVQQPRYGQQIVDALIPF